MLWLKTTPLTLGEEEQLFEAHVCMGSNPYEEAVGSLELQQAVTAPTHEPLHTLLTLLLTLPECLFSLLSLLLCLLWLLFVRAYSAFHSASHTTRARHLNLISPKTHTEQCCVSQPEVPEDEDGKRHHMRLCQIGQVSRPGQSFTICSLGHSSMLWRQQHASVDCEQCSIPSTPTTAHQLTWESTNG